MRKNYFKIITFIPEKIDEFFAKFLIFFIRIYQKTFSPDHGIMKNKTTGCKFFPTCSDYAILVLQKKGFILGIGKIIWRICRCNPWQKNKIDNP